MNMLLDESEIESSFDDRSLMDLVIETVSKCSDEYDDGVQLQVNTCFFHESKGLRNFLSLCMLIIGYKSSANSHYFITLSSS